MVQSAWMGAALSSGPRWSSALDYRRFHTLNLIVHFPMASSTLTLLTAFRTS